MARRAREGNAVPIKSPTAAYAVGYRRPPVQNRFKPGQSGNPSGRTKGSKNIKTVFEKILNEQVSLREGSTIRTVTKSEAILRGLVVNAMKGDARSITTLFRLAETTGQLDNEGSEVTAIRRIIVETGVPRRDDGLYPARSEFCTEK
jgi:Family of unknown function (DUF5681)